MMLQQKRIEMLNVCNTKETKDVTLLDFMCKSWSYGDPTSFI